MMLRQDYRSRAGVPTGREALRLASRARAHLPPRSSLSEPLTSASELRTSNQPSTSTQPDLEAAWELLRDFTRKEFRGVAQDPYLSSPAKRQRLREALKLAYGEPYSPAGWLGPAAASSEVLLGVVASDIRFAARAYRDWCEELGLPLVTPASRVDGVGNAMQLRGGVYLKYNSNTQLCYVSRYDGRDRGVLIQLGQLQLGHFPLGLFDEALAKPPPVF